MILQILEMPPCPAITLDVTLSSARELAFALRQVSQKKCSIALCLQVGESQVSLEAFESFVQAISEALAPDQFLTRFIEKKIPTLRLEEIYAFRPLWAYHISRSIYEQIGE